MKSGANGTIIGAGNITDIGKTNKRREEMDNEFLETAKYASKVFNRATNDSKRRGNHVVVMRDPTTGEEKNLTMPGPQRSAENSCRRFKAIGIENIFGEEQKKRKRTRKKK